VTLFVYAVVLRNNPSGIKRLTPSVELSSKLPKKLERGGSTSCYKYGDADIRGRHAKAKARETRAHFPHVFLKRSQEVAGLVCTKEGEYRALAEKSIFRA
jgi:hypothetical protein